jgi:transketolase
MRTRFIETLVDIAAADERVWLLTADLGYSVLEVFRDRFPDRYVNVGVAEQNLVGVAAGLASTGIKPYLYSIANFPTLRCLEQIRNDICYHGFDVKIVAVGGGLAYGSQGYTHHGVEDLAILRTLPGMTVVAPGDPTETRLAVTALHETPGPAYLRLGKANEPVLYDTPPAFTLGKAIEVRPGRDGAFLSTGAMLGEAIQVRDRLREERGMEIRILSFHTLKPLDDTAIARCARETPWMITLEEHSVTGGLGGAVAEVLAEMPGVRARLIRHGLPDRVNHRFGSQEYLRKHLMGDLADRVASLQPLRRAA